MLDARLLRLFAVLAEDLHFGRAAERLNISQPTLSAQLRRLEDSLGASLFHRRKRAAVHLTEAGKIFLSEAHETLARLERAEIVGRRAGRGEAGPLDIGYVFSAALTGVLPRALRLLQARLPDLALRPVLSETPEQIRGLAERRLDIGFVRPRPHYPDDVEARTVHREPVIACLSEQHPLASSTCLEAASLGNETFLLPQFNETSGLQEKLSLLAELGGFEMPKVTRTRDFVTAASLAAGNIGVVLAPCSLVNLHLEGLCFRQIVDFHETIDIVMIGRRDRPSASAAAFSALADLPGPPLT